VKKLSKLGELRLVACSMATCMAVSASATGIDNFSDGDCGNIRDLQSKYLRCESLAQSGQLDSARIAFCSDVYYRLKAQAFQDDFSRIREWYEAIVSLRGLEIFLSSSSNQPNRQFFCP
jgi:hypothetical protein